MILFKIWSGNRQEKYFVLVKAITNIYQDVITQASIKLRKPIERIVLEKDGTLVDEEEILILLKDETLIALSSSERWLSPQESSIITTSLIPPITPVSHSSPSNSALVESSTISAAKSPSPPPLPRINTLEEMPTTTEAGVSLADLSEMGLKKDTYDISFETTHVMKTDISDSSDTCNINNDIFYTDDINSRQSDIFDTASMLHDRNMEFAWSKFQIPWDKIPTHMIITCEEGKKSKQIVTEIIHIIVNEMRQIKTNIPVKTFKLVALKLADRFPYVFRDSDEDGVVIGDGTHSITMKLLDRNNYLNRSRRKRSANFHESKKDHETLRSARIGCFNWEPTQISSTENLQAILRDMDPNDENFNKFLNETYADQRKFFNNVISPPSIFEIKLKWPAILTTAGIFWHFAALTSIHLNNIIKNIIEKSTKLIKFGIYKKLVEEKDIRDDKELTSLDIISRYFKEDLNTLFKTYMEIDKAQIPTGELSEIPTVVRFENFCESGYVVYLERVPINDTIYTSFVDAFAVSYALYFITNLQYPQDICFTMEMVQRYYCKIQPDSGSKSKKKIGAKAKVITLINKLHQPI